MADTSKPSPKASSETTKTQDIGQNEMQETFDEANEKGYFGTEVDPTPNENYTVKGVASGAPTPETDADAKAKAAKAITEAGQA